MTIRHPVFLAAVAATSLWSQIAVAEQPVYSSSAELGAGWVSTDSFKFGEYTGLEEKGVFAIGNASVERRSAYDSGSTEYWEVTGSNLGLESRSARVEYGQQGRFSFFADYDQIPHFRLDDAKTVFNGAGDANLTLPSNWVGATTTAGMTTLQSNLKSVDIETERMEYGGGFSWIFAKSWQLDGEYHRQHKDGTEVIAGIFGTNGGNPRSAFLPMPIDQDTDEANISLKYSGKKLQGELAYHLSLYDNNEDSLTWENPFLNPGGFAPWNAAADFAGGGQGRLALDPDNQAHHISLSGGYTVDPTTRLAGSFSYGIMLQDDDFLPFTVNPTLAASVATPLPRSSLDGQVNTMHGNLTVTSRPLPKVDVKARYTFNDRDNQTPKDVYVGIRNDTETQGAATSDRARINRPYSRTQHKFELDGGYRIMPRTKVSAGYDFEYINRDINEVETTLEHTGRVKLRSAPVHYASGWVEYAHSIRSGDDYVSNQQFLDSHTSAYIATLTPATGLYENDPLLRKYYFADRDKDQVTASVTLMPHDQVTVGLRGSLTLERYDETEIGLTDRDTASITLDASFMPRPDITLSAYGTFDRIRQAQDGYQRSGVDLFPGFARTAGDFWTVETVDNAYTAGLGAEWAVIADRLNLAADYTFSRALTEYDIEGGSNLTFAGLPQVVTTLHSLSLSGDVQVRENVSVRLGYIFEWFESKDFALDNVDQDTLANVITLGESSPDYTAHVVGLSAILKF